MARNGSGVYSKVNTFVSGNSITASGHNQNWDDIATEMTNSVAADGQTSMSGALKLSNGTVAAPAVTFASDTDSGFYRIGANDVGGAVNGAKVWEMSTAGIAVTGTFGVSSDFAVATSKFTVAAATGNTAIAGTLGVTGVASHADGTVGTPGINFTSDPDCGVYHIGANNIGVAVNGAKVLDIGTGGLGVTGTLTTTSSVAIAAGGLTITAGGLTVTAGSVSLPAASVANAALANPSGMTLIKTQTASSSATLDFVNGVSGVVLDDTYDDYMFVLSNIKPATDDVEMQMTVGTGAGPTYHTSASDYQYQSAIFAGGAANGFGSTVATHMALSASAGSGANVGNATGENISGRVMLHNPEATDFCQFNYETSYSAAAGTHSALTGGGRYNTAGAITAIRFAFSSGNIASGRITLYGMTKV